MRACETLGGELACINDEAENSFVTDLLIGNDDYWIGLNDRDVDNTFQWANKQCTSEYRNWMVGEPNNAAGGLEGDPDCVRMCPSDASPGYVDGSCQPGQWADYACPAENHYVCEIRGCPVGWIAHGGSCYAGFTSPPGTGLPESGATWQESQKKSHSDAMDACATLGATLVHIDDAAENAWIASMLPPLGTDDYWLGAVNQDTDGRTPTSSLAWQGDEGGAAPDTGGYTNWFPGEPNNAGGGVNYDAGESACVRMCPFGESESRRQLCPQSIASKPMTLAIVACLVWPGDSGGYDPTGQVHCTRGGWADYPCSTPYRYICGMLPNLSHSTPLLPRSQSQYCRACSRKWCCCRWCCSLQKNGGMTRSLLVLSTRAPTDFCRD